MLEIVLSDHAYRYSNDQQVLHGAVSRGEHQSLDEVELGLGLGVVQISKFFITLTLTFPLQHSG
jgi:hypothetical protein